ncbi:hypothetical protein [Marinobacter sp.]|uniref:hypothetical protein n=1 Tax=Marinobacter sp. TaxID=50741 RepID=UPI003A958340
MNLTKTKAELTKEFEQELPATARPLKVLVELSYDKLAHCWVKLLYRRPGTALSSGSQRLAGQEVALSVLDNPARRAEWLAQFIGAVRLDLSMAQPTE